MIEVYLPDKPKPVIFDELDFSVWQSRSWNYYEPHRTVMGSKWNMCVQFSREIMGLKRKDTQVVDHINGNRLDNRRANLRICTHKENSRNRTKSVGKTSKHKGVHYEADRKRWRASIRYDGKLICLGRYKSEEAASTAYDNAATKYFGKFAKTNQGKE
jgi:hypothetical protein